MKKKLKKSVSLTMKALKAFSVLIIAVGILASVVVLGISIYEISINTHHGSLEMTNGTRSFIMSAILFATFISSLGVMSFFKSQSILEKIKL